MRTVLRSQYLRARVPVPKQAFRWMRSLVVGAGVRIPPGRLGGAIPGSDPPRRPGDISVGGQTEDGEEPTQASACSAVRTVS